MVVAVFAGACGNTTRDAGASSGGKTGSDAGLAPDGSDAAEGGASGTSADAGIDAAPDCPAECCASGTMHSSLIPVHGTVGGPRVDAVLCDNGAGTSFLGPEGAADSSYAQSLSTTVDASGSLADSFLVRMPSEAVSLSLNGWVGATLPEVGTYASTENCGWLTVEVSLPIPSGVVCPPIGESCAPDCEPVGELGVCMPAEPRWRYTALPEAPCDSISDPARGEWELTLTEVSAHAGPERLINFQTHGRLVATLVNDDDASDSVDLDLEF